MKRLFAINLSDETDEPLTEEKFTVKQYESDELFDKVDAIEDQYKKDTVKFRAPNLVKSIILTVVDLIVMFSMVAYMKSPAGENAPTFTVILMMAVCLGLIVATYYFKKQSQAPVMTEEAIRLAEEKDNAVKKLYISEGIPENAENVDILHFTYEIGKSGFEKNVLCSIEPLWIFEENGNIMLSDQYMLYSIPKSEFTEIKYIEDIVSVSTYQPNTPISRKCRESGLKIKNGYIHFAEYLSVRFTHEGEEHEIRFPTYEATTLSRILSIYPKH